MNQEILLRRFVPTDVLQVTAIECLVNVSPWNEEAFTRTLAVGYPGWILEQQDTLIGFSFMSLAADECQILNLAIHPGWQQQGLGKRLLKHMLHYAEQCGAARCYLEVRCSNKIAQILYTRLGYTVIARRKNYYLSAAGREDAVIMAVDLPRPLISETVCIL